MTTNTPPELPAACLLLLDTDIGTDIDDVYALIFAAVSPEFDLRGVSVVNNDVGLRARIARRVLSPPCRVTLTVDAPCYHALLQSRVQEAVRQAAH